MRIITQITTVFKVVLANENGLDDEMIYEMDHI